MISDFFFEGSKGISEVTSTPKNATIASAAWAHPCVPLIFYLFKFLHLFLLQHLHSLLLPLPLLFPLLPLSCPNCLSNPLLNPQPHLIFLHNIIKIHLISEINNSMLLSIVKICTLLFKLDLIGKNCQRNYTNVLIVVLDVIQCENAFSLRHQLVKLLFVSSLNSNNSLKNGKLKWPIKGFLCAFYLF